ncbi:MAG: hypothetical protein SFU99_04605 [Saprospiraceae bacterium]|nr:hypothetical protein [Saprospiraceae bacterium]
MKNQEDFTGFEFDWFAKDINSNIGLFATAGSGFIPEEVLSHHDQHEEIANMLPHDKFGTNEVWNELAEQGLYVFDWGYFSGKESYNKMAIPLGKMNNILKELILNINELPKLDVDFKTAERILPNQINKSVPED